MVRRRRGGFSRGRRFTRGGRNFQWCSVFFGPETIAPDELDEIPLLVVPDYAGNTNVSPSGVTLHRTILNIAINCGSAQQSGGSWCFGGIGVVDADETVTWDPTGADLTDERWIWTGVTSHCMVTLGSPVQTTASQSGNLMAIPPWSLDIRQKVRLRDTGLSLYLKSPISSVNNTNFFGTGRFLISGSTT